MTKTQHDLDSFLSQSFCLKLHKLHDPFLRFSGFSCQSHSVTFDQKIMWYKVELMVDLTNSKPSS